MSQNSLTLPTTGTVSGLQMTQDINNALDTLNTLASGASAPGSPEAGQFWHDTTNNVLKLRSQDNTTWMALINFNESAYLAMPAFPSQVTGSLNRVINSGMQIDQVNEGSSYSVPNNNTPTYGADQWVASCSCSGATGVTAQQVGDAPAGFVNSLKVTVGTGASSVGATDFLYVYQPIEANNLDDLCYATANAVTTSLSFWVKSSVAGTFAALLQNNAGNRSLVNKFTITSAGVWQKVTIPGIPGDQSGTWAAGNNAMLRLFIVIATGTTNQTTTLNAWAAGGFLGSNLQTNTVLTTSGATFQLTGVMWNPGSFCLPYEKHSVQQELRGCQRYFEKSYDAGTAVAATVGNGSDYFVAAATTAGMSMQMKVTKRADPTVTLYSPNSGSSGKAYDSTASADVSMSAANIGQNNFTVSSPSLTSGHQIQEHWTASARM